MCVIKDLVRMRKTLLMEADPLARPRTEWTRIQLVVGMDFFSYTGARIGAIFPADDDKARRVKGLRYKVSIHTLRLRLQLLMNKKDLKLTLLPRNGQRDELVLSFSQRWIKNNLDTENQGYVSKSEHLRGPLLITNRITIGIQSLPNILHDTMPWFLAMAFTCSAFKHFKTIHELMEQQVPKEMDLFDISWKDEVLDAPVFRQTPSSLDPMTQSQWRASWDPLVQQAGYTKTVTIHRIRQGVCNALEGQSRSRRFGA
jgi:hypothetical protein